MNVRSPSDTPTTTGTFRSRAASKTALRPRRSDTLKCPTPTPFACGCSVTARLLRGRRSHDYDATGMPMDRSAISGNRRPSMSWRRRTPYRCWAQAPFLFLLPPRAAECWRDMKVGVVSDTHLPRFGDRLPPGLRRGLGEQGVEL